MSRWIYIICSHLEAILSTPQLIVSRWIYIVCSHSAAILSITSTNSSTIDLFCLFASRSKSFHLRLLHYCNQNWEFFYPPLMYSMDILSIFKLLHSRRIHQTWETLCCCLLHPDGFLDSSGAPRVKCRHVIWTSSTAARFLGKLHHVLLWMRRCNGGPALLVNHIFSKYFINDGREAF
jgi:hypothetical protein